MRSWFSRLQTVCIAVLPVCVVTFLDDVPSFVFADCNYAGAVHAVAASYEIDVDGSTLLEGFTNDCPCSWTIQSQPGGWKVTGGSGCTAVLEPINLEGDPGTITIAFEDDASQTDSVQVTAKNCVCPTVPQPFQISQAAVATLNVEFDAQEGYVFDVAYPTFVASGFVSNPGKDGEVGFVQIMKDGKHQYAYSNCACTEGVKKTLNNGPLNDGRNKPPAPCSTANCPWAHFKYQRTAGGPTPDSCGPIQLDCGDLVSMVHADTPRYKLTHASRQPYAVAGERLFHLYVVWICDGSKEIRADKQFFVSFEAVYTGDCPNGNPDKEDYYFDGFSDAELGPKNMDSKNCPKLCEPEGAVDCTCGGDGEEDEEEYANYNAEWDTTDVTDILCCDCE